MVDLEILLISAKKMLQKVLMYRFLTEKFREKSLHQSEMIINLKLALMA